MLRQENYTQYHPQLIHAINDGDQDKRVDFSELFLHVVDRGKLDVDHVLRSDKAIVKLNGSINHHNCVYWTAENLNVTIDAHENLSGVCVWCAMSLEGIVGPFFSMDQ